MLFSKANFGTLSTSLCIQACGAVTGVLTARLLGPVARGELATVILWPTILSNLGLMGCNWVLAREVAKDPQREPDWLAAGLAVVLAAAAIYLLAGYFALPFLIPAQKRYLIPIARLCLFLIPLDTGNQILLAVEQGRMRWRRYNLLRLSFFLFYVVLIACIGAGRKAWVQWFVSAFLASHLLAVLLRLWIQRTSLLAGKLHAARACRLLRAGVPYFGATVSNLLSLQLDTILVVSFLSTQAAGIYVVAAAFANGQSSLGEALGITSFAILSNEPDAEEQKALIGEMFRQYALVSFGLGLFLAGLIPVLVVPVFGFEFGRAVRPAVVLALAASLAALTNILNQALCGAGRPHAGLVSQLLGTAVMAVAALFLLRGYGLMGMAFAVWAGACAQLLALIAAAAKWLKISPLEFWPFGAGNFKHFFQQVANLRLRYLRSPA